MTKANEWFVVVNPFSGKGDGARAWLSIYPALDAAELEYDALVCDSLDILYAVVSEKLREGYRKFLCVGGDGSLHHLVNAILKEKSVKSNDVSIALISVGTGNDFVKTHRWPTKIVDAVQLIIQEKSIAHDLGLVHYTGFDGRPNSRYFINIAGLGFDAAVVKNSLEKSSWMGSWVYYWGILKTLFQYQALPMDIETSHFVRKSDYYMCLVAVCRYAGGGMKLAPEADATDGLFDVSLIGALSRWEVLWHLNQLKDGRFITHPKVESLRAATLKIKAGSGTVSSNLLVEADGELLGLAPVQFEICAGAIKVLIP